MRNFLTKGGVALGVWAVPALALAQKADFSTLEDYTDSIIDFINDFVVPLIFAIAFLIFIWGAFQYFIFSKGSEEGQEKGKDLMLWGFIGFFVMVAVWGIVNLLVGASGLDPDQGIDVPKFNAE